MIKFVERIFMRLESYLGLAIAYITASSTDRPLVMKLILGAFVLVAVVVLVKFGKEAYRAWLNANRDLPSVKKRLDDVEKELVAVRGEAEHLRVKLQHTFNGETLAEDLIENRLLLREYLARKTTWEDAHAACLETLNLSSQAVLSPTGLVEYFGFWLPSGAGNRLQPNPVGWIASEISDKKGIEVAARKFAERHQADRDQWQVPHPLKNKSFPGRWIAVHTLHADGTLLGILTVVTRSSEALECSKGIIELYAHEAGQFLSHGCSVRVEGDTAP